jgi:hypothetical protein
MRKLLSLIALFGVIAIADIALSPSANATVLTTGIHALKTEQAGVAELARTTCWWRNGRRHCTTVHRRRHCWWHRGVRHCRWW